MDIKHIEMTPSAGGYTRLMMIVSGDRSLISESVSKAGADPDKYEVEIKRKRSKRGLTANAYYWVLVDKLSKVLGTSKDEMHEELMRSYGTYKLNSQGKPVVFSIPAGEDPKGVAKHSRSFAEGYVNGKRFIHYAVLKGSSEMDAKEFSDLLDGLISECKEQRIEVMPQAELEHLEYLNTTHTDN